MRLPSGLLLITDRRRAVRPLGEVCRAALDAGFCGVMLREKDLPARELLELAVDLERACVAAGAQFWVNERLDVALALESAGGHVGVRGLEVSAARGLLGPERGLGYSAHELDEARRALDRGADFVTLSPVFGGISKADVVGRGVGWLAEAAAFLPRGTVFALGGVDVGNVVSVRAAGAGGAAVMGAVMQAEDPGSVARELVRGWV